jgi:hypothetical protein
MPDKWVGSYATTACKCSCWMCGNPRHYFKAITHQEYQAQLKFIEGCEEVDVYCSLSLNRLGKIE